MGRKQIIVVGGGPAALMAADVLSAEHHVRIFEQGKNIGQKFLLAGKGGFNLTNSAHDAELTVKYSPAGFMNNALHDFDSANLRNWLSEMNIPTFIGSSGRVFPEKHIRPIDVLNQIKKKLQNNGVVFHLHHEFVGFDNDKHVVFKNGEEEIVLHADYIIFALGGASWPITGSNGSWRAIFDAMGVKTNAFQASNCGVNIRWPESIVKNHAGKPLKNIKLSVQNHEILGEALITDYGMEGNALYPLIPAIRDMLIANLAPAIHIDFKPMNTIDQLIQKPNGKEIKTKDYSKVFNLGTAQLALLKAFSTRESFISIDGFVSNIKKLIIPIQSLRPVEEAISTVGGIPVQELNNDFSLKKYPWIYTIGEMVDWDAPTGGFLLQGCFSMGNYAANAILKK